MRNLLLTVAGGAALLAAGAVIQYTRELRQLEQVEAFLEREAAKQHHPSYRPQFDIKGDAPARLIGLDEYKAGGRFDV